MMNQQNAEDKSYSVPAVPVLNLERAKPNNQDAEMAVLGSMMIDPDAANAAMSALKFPGAFYRPAHQAIFDAMLALSQGSDEKVRNSRAYVDPVILGNYLENNGRLEEVGGREYLNRLMESQITAANIESYVDIVRQNAMLRMLIQSSTDAITRCYEGAEAVPALLDRAQQSLYEISKLNATKEMQSIHPLVSQAVRYLNQLSKTDGCGLGLKTGFAFDRMLNGLHPGELVILAARPSIGKTALALNIATNIAMKGHGVGIFSLEMPALQLALRMICSLTRISLGDFRRNYVTTAQWNDMMAVASEVAKANLIIDDTSGIDIVELRAKARRMVEQHKAEVIFIDYLQLAKAHGLNKNASRENEVAMISGGLKSLAKDLNIPVVALAQINRTSEQSNEEPKLANLRESGAIEQDADVVMLLHRNRNKQYEQKQEDDTPLEAEVIVAKNRNGATGKQKLLFFPRITKFEDPAPEYAAEGGASAAEGGAN